MAEKEKHSSEIPNDLMRAIGASPEDGGSVKFRPVNNASAEVAAEVQYLFGGVIEE